MSINNISNFSIGSTPNTSVISPISDKKFEEGLINGLRFLSIAKPVSEQNLRVVAERINQQIFVSPQTPSAAFPDRLNLAFDSRNIESLFRQVAS